MHLDHQRSDQRRSALPGFSLVVILPLLLLLLVVLLGLLTLSSSVSRKGVQKGVPEDEARANARLALTLAIGELQKYLGPDRRVSAPAGILDSNPESPRIDGVTQPHWTAVWSTEWPENGEPGSADTPWVRDADHGGLRDRRFESGYDRRDEVLSYLVSGNEGGNGDEIISAVEVELPPNAITVVGPGSVSRTQDEVKVLRVPTTDGNNEENGAYAFWVGDLGVKAHVALTDHYAYAYPRRGGGPRGMERLVNPQDVEESLIPGIRKLRAGESRRLISDRTIGLASRNTTKTFQFAFHDMTTWSRSVLANVREGGLQRDLTAFLHSNGRISDLQSDTEVLSAGLQDGDHMIGPANPLRAFERGIRWNDTKYRDISPKFSMLRGWQGRAESRPWESGEVEMITPESITDNSLLRGMLDGVNVYDASNLRPTALTPERPNLAPVMVEGSLYYNLATYPANPGNPASRYALRLCLYPRIALWNPFDVALKTPPLVASLFVNGNKDVRVRYQNGVQQVSPIPFGRGSTKVGASSQTGPDVSPAHYVGWLLLNIDSVTMEPGETLVFSPARTQEYELFNVFRNELVSHLPPDPSRYFYQDMQGEHLQPPVSFIEFPGPGTESGSENYMMSLKDARSVNGRVTDQNFNTLPSVVYANVSLQAGAANELPVAWIARTPAPVYRLLNPREMLPGSAIPDVRTRDGFRLRWWEEHSSNIRGSGRLRANPEHLQTSLLGTWNPRAAYFCRNPFDNVSDKPPYFHGAYTRDLFDPAVSWQGMMPRVKDSRMQGNPFGPPIGGADRVALFEVPKAEIGIPSIGYLRHLKLSELGWDPSYAVGNSLVDPRVGRTTTVPVIGSSTERTNHGWNRNLFGWAQGQDDGRGQDYWAMLFRQILFDLPTDNQVVHDSSYELNYTLWDDYFLSTGDAARKRRFADSEGRFPLPNGRFTLQAPGPDWNHNDLTNFHRAASLLMLEGGFNVHSISKNAWKAVLASTLDTRYSRRALPFPRLLNPPAGEWMSGDSDGAQDDEGALAGFRSITGEQLDRLAEEIVREVKERAPFFGLSDFVNRRLADSEHGDRGPLEAAISATGLNAVWERGRYEIDNGEDLPDVSFNSMTDSTRLDQSLKPDSVAWGIPGYLTQGDLLQAVGSSLRARSDTFVVRAYGEAVDETGKVTARAWCEAVVQRTAEPVLPDPAGLNPDEDEPDLGRWFRQVSFRWLSEEEV